MNSHNRLHWRPHGGVVAALPATFQESKAPWSAEVWCHALFGVRSNPRAGNFARCAAAERTRGPPHPKEFERHSKPGESNASESERTRPAAKIQTNRGARGRPCYSDPCARTNPSYRDIQTNPRPAEILASPGCIRANEPMRLRLAAVLKRIRRVDGRQKGRVARARGRGAGRLSRSAREAAWPPTPEVSAARRAGDRPEPRPPGSTLT